MIPESVEANKGWLRRPRLRPVEAFPVQTQEGEALCLRDPSRAAPEMVLLNPQVAVILAYFTGDLMVEEIQAEVLQGFGLQVDPQVILELADVLDQRLLLEGPTFERHLQAVKDAFAQSPVREAVLSGSAYNDEPVELAKQLESYALEPKGPGPRMDNRLNGNPRALVAPHIDFNRGGPCYAHSYRQMSPVEAPDLVVILGTAHSPTFNFLSLCTKDFATPFGPARLDKRTSRELTDRLGDSLLKDEFVHRGEHSVEFQAVWMMNLYGGSEKIRFLPFLCGSLYPLIMNGKAPWELDEFETPIVVLKEVLDRAGSEGRKVLILGSADLSHVGHQFGDDFLVTPEVAEQTKNYDLKLLDEALRGDPRAFFHYAALHNDKTHVCGLSSIYTLLRLTGGAGGSLLAYDQWIDEKGEGLVSFAGLAFP